MTTITELVPAQVSSELEDEIKTNEELANDKDEPKVSSESVVQEELNDSLDNCNFAEKSVDTEPVVVKRKPGRPPKKRPLPEEESSELTEVNDTEPVDNQDTVVAERAEPRRRGRKPKDKNGEKYVPDPKKRGIMAGSDAPLRRRDRITPLARYSPPPHQPSKRGRRGGTSFPSTSSTRYLNFTDEGAKESYVLDFKKDESSNKMLITVSDGTTYKVDATPVPAGSKGTKARNDEDEEYDVDDDGALEDVEDDEYKPTYNERRKMKKKPDSTDEPMKLPGRQAKTKKPVWKPARAGGSALSADVASDGGHRMTKITSGTTTGKTKVTIITTPKSVTLTPAFNKPNVRTYGSGTARYIDELPDISECTLDSSQKDMSRLPDAILLLNAELPLQYEIGESSSRTYVFKQVLSPFTAGFLCLLCHQSTIMKTEKELCHHYSSQHEMRIEKSTCRFSDEIVHVCLPKTSLALVTESRGSEVPLNHECQYCDDVTLKNVDELVPHYVDAHGKSVEFIEQEVIISMHKFLYCSVCTEQFKNFKELHEHYIASHQLYTFTCKSCHFFTQDSMRLRSHFKAKHLMSSSVQNIQCPYCNGLIQGAERMSKHIISNHCVQTAPNEYSCKSCSQVAGKPLQLYEHSLRCGHHGHSDRDNSDNMTGSSRGNDGQQSETENHANSNAASNGIEMESLSCSLCDMTFTSSEKYELHFNHVHARWVNRNVIHDTFLMVKHASGKTDLVPKPTGENGEERIMLSDLPDEKLLQDIGVKTLRGHYCFKCETIIENYCLYYMHMYNVHKMDKMFVCRISSCKQSFKGSQQYLDHIDATGHGQKSVIEDTLVKACHYCDLIFANIDEYQKHLITDEHYVKLQTSEKHNQRPEPRNFKCKTCHTWFGLRDSYIHHMENETHKHYCPYCGLHFALPSSRRIHIQSHHPEKQDICEVCTAKYGTKERLSGHLVEHGILHECKSCTKRFYQCEQLNAHMDCHDDVIDCPWEECSKKLTLSILSSHIRQHRIERNSKCGTCNKVFANQLLLVSHMDVHAKADQNARAILNSVAAEKTRSPAKVDNATTLISITTPKVPTSGSLMSRTNLKRSRIQKSPPMKTEIPEGLRVMCCTCKQHFNSQPELYSHKCNVALAGSTVAQDRPRAQESLTATIIPSESADSVQQATFELNGNQYIININGQSDAELVDSIQSQSSSQQSVNLDMQTTKDKTAFVRKRRPQASRSNSNAQQELQSAVQVVTDTEAQETQEDSQTFVVQQPDGEIFQITIPAGMDANEFLINLYASGDSGVLSADQIIVDTDATQNGDQVSQEDESQTVSHIALENSSSVGQQAANGDQVLYIPSNEGGVTYTLDPEALALLMASSDVPLVVGS